MQYITTENKLKTVVILTENQRQHLSDGKNLSDTHRGRRPYREPDQHCVFPVNLGESGPAGVSVTCICNVMDGLYRLPGQEFLRCEHVAILAAAGMSVSTQ